MGKTRIWKYAFTPMFITTLFTIVKTWKQSKCPSTNEWIKKLQYICIYNRILLSHQKEWDNVICSNMNGPRDCHTEWRKTERERWLQYDSNYIWNLKYDANKLIYKTEIDTDIEMYDYQRGRRKREIWNLGLTYMH